MDADAVSIGGGTTYINLHTERDDLTVRVNVDKGLTRLVLTPGAKAAPRVTRAPSVDELIEHIEFRERDLRQ